MTSSRTPGTWRRWVNLIAEARDLHGRGSRCPATFPHHTTAEPDAGDVEALTEAERREIAWTFHGAQWLSPERAECIGRIVAARVAAARADERERIVQALVNAGHLNAARIARESR